MGDTAFNDSNGSDGPSAGPSSRGAVSSGGSGDARTGGSDASAPGCSGADASGGAGALAGPNATARGGFGVEASGGMGALAASRGGVRGGHGNDGGVSGGGPDIARLRPGIPRGEATGHERHAYRGSAPGDTTL